VRGRFRVIAGEGPEPPAFGQEVGNHLGLGGEVPRPPGHVRRPQRLEQFVQAVRVMADAVEAHQHSTQEHFPQPLLGRANRRGDCTELPCQPVDDPVDGRQGHRLLAGDVEVERSFAEARLAGDIFHRRLLVPEARQEALGRVKDAVTGRRHRPRADGGHCANAPIPYFGIL